MGVEYNGLDYQAYADVDLSDEGVEYLPQTYTGSDLHDATIEGGEVQVPVWNAVSYLKRELREMIESGEIDVDELLGSE